MKCRELEASNQKLAQPVSTGILISDFLPLISDLKRREDSNSLFSIYYYYIRR
jgi:hypothetical protein